MQQIPAISSNLNTMVPLSQLLYVTDNDEEESILDLPMFNVQNHQLNSTETQSNIPSSEVQLNTDQIQQEQENEIMFDIPQFNNHTGDNNDNSIINNVEMDKQTSSPAQDNLFDKNSYSGSTTASNSEQSDPENEEDDLGRINARNEKNEPVMQNNNNNNNFNQLLEREREAHGDTCCNSCRIILLQLIRKVDNVLLYFENGNVNMNQRRIENPVPTYDKLDILPIDNIELLKEFDQNLVRRDAVNRELETQFRTKISNCGESDMKKAVVMILPKILTNQLGTKLVWMIKSEGKVPIQNFNFPAIIASIFSAKYNCTEEEVKKRIKLWLQKSGDRIRADQRKAERNRDELD
ncbi:probable serine/threonine-protein kinase tsuA isoform X2 [Nasonia vitripennis]|uniref:DUF4806 domain-containing protein n=1 Tax=Nasonia vitripennis TaxID=7425 RepID=A0A7M7QN26_NASVI|nr:probable serine/threonine-protein kinase tsuA isoform X2 [Nasonia vitripennis]